ncbi:hypothetical protein DFJ67_6199 [Asanoa ferruginea]|uniref:Uncharacterized protein n=1 Tax=Asanoa ferruginea TaxID=53367 RepID=A0A3D9ZRW5_9ACTN|nr:hypothetical protein [Asanoa ferruginea]REG00149.1 hypothetical protein DFJ67_6199 [Asanoa ferruginea]GIF46153.1 hypothetical protein Afe04nite_06920 [Asanoa ferruginea]
MSRLTVAPSGNFRTARAYTRIAHEECDLRLVVGVLWNNYLPGTRGAARAFPGALDISLLARDVDLGLSLTTHRLTGWDLADRAPLTPDAVHDNGRTTVRQLPTAGDQLVIAERRA